MSKLHLPVPQNTSYLFFLCQPVLFREQAAFCLFFSCSLKRACRPWFYFFFGIHEFFSVADDEAEMFALP